MGRLTFCWKPNGNREAHRFRCGGRQGSATLLHGAGDRAVVEGAPDVGELQQRARLLQSTGRHKEAVQLLLQVVAQRPDDPTGFRALALAAQGAGDHRDALAWARKAVALGPDDSVNHAALGEVLLLSGQPTEAIGPLHRALELGAYAPNIAFHLGRCYLQLANWSQASLHFELVIKEQPWNGAAHANLSIALRQLGQRKRADEHIRRAAELEPGHAGVLRILGSTHLSSGRPEDAREALESSLRIDPRDQSAQVKHAIARAGSKLPLGGLYAHWRPLRILVVGFILTAVASSLLHDAVERSLGTPRADLADGIFVVISLLLVAGIAGWLKWQRLNVANYSWKELPREIGKRWREPRRRTLSKVEDTRAGRILLVGRHEPTDSPQAAWYVAKTLEVFCWFGALGLAIALATGLAGQNQKGDTATIAIWAAAVGWAIWMLRKVPLEAPNRIRGSWRWVCARIAIWLLGLPTFVAFATVANAISHSPWSWALAAWTTILAGSGTAIWFLSRIPRSRTMRAGG